MEFIVVLLADDDWFIHNHGLQQDAEREVAELVIQYAMDVVESGDLSEYYRAGTARLLYFAQPKQEIAHAEE